MDTATATASFETLREKALALLESGDHLVTKDFHALAPEVEKLIHELETYDAELTLQNKQLRSAEQSLSALLNKFETLFDSLPLASLVVDESAVVKQANQFAARLLGFRSRDTLENHSLLRLVDSHDRSQLFGRITHLASGGTTQVGPVLLTTDPPVITDFYLTRLPPAYHLDRHMLVAIVERTEHYNRLRKLSLLQAMVDRTDARIFAFDQYNRCLFANTRELEEIGLPAEKVLGKRRDQWLPGADATRCERTDAMVFTTEQNYVYEEKLPGEPPRYFMTHKFPLIDEEGDVFGVGSISTEITQDREYRDRLNLAMMAYSLGQEAIAITDVDNNFISVNGAFTRITGYTEHEVIGQNPRLLASGRHPQSFYANMWEGIRNNSYWEGEIWNRRKNGEIYPQWLSVSRVPGGMAETTNYIGVFSDITKRKMAEEEIEQLAFFDVLTGLPNRHLLSDRVDQQIRAASREQQGFAFIFFDLDRFKQINDVYGHAAGDEILKEVARRVSHLVREQDTLSRLGGDEFVLLLSDIDLDRIRARVNDVLEAIREPVLYDTHNLSTSASFGIAMYPEDGNDFETLLKNADTAMYEAKDHGRDTLQFFNRRMAKRAQQRLGIENALRHSISNGEFTLVYQPQYRFGDQAMVGAEALLRWNSPTLGAISPAVFIPVAEQAGLIDEIGRWVLEQAFLTQCQIMQQHDGFYMAINVSARQFESESFIDDLKELIDKTHVDPRCIELEITETMIMSKPEWSKQILQQLKQMGFRLSLDDFGTGYSSMAYLRWMPIDLIKLDRSFVRGLSEGSEEFASSSVISQSIIGLAHSLGLKAIAEGVETQSAADFLQEKGCDYAQGFLYSKPVPLPQLLTML